MNSNCVSPKSKKLEPFSFKKLSGFTPFFVAPVPLPSNGLTGGDPGVKIRAKNGELNASGFEDDRKIPVNEN